jgi:hypothetical protein
MDWAMIVPLSLISLSLLALIYGYAFNRGWQTGFKEGGDIWKRCCDDIRKLYEKPSA